MMHSSPMPLHTALDLVKRLHHELAKHMTPEQKRDITRVERLIQEASANHKTELTRLRQAAVAKPDPAPARKGFWG